MKLAGAEKEAFREELKALGFDDVRFTDLSPVSENRLEQWCEAGYHADMEWLKRSIEKRLNPDLVLEDVCSVIMFGVNYFPDEDLAASQKRWAKYSMYLDYHDTVLDGVKEAGKLLQEKFELGDRDYRYYVDTGPVMERGWAAASGMGWQGKNAMLISRTEGNWLLLATILTRVNIEPDLPLKKGSLGSEAPKAEMGLLCGKCTRCIDACPTDAIVQPGMVDANLCISYQTIENKGVIPRELRAKIGTRIYGCDICLDICPWNRFASAGRQNLLAKRYHVAALGLLQILRMDVEEFREVFRKMPMKRLKLRGLLRNACIVAGNLLEQDEWWPEGISEAEKGGFLKEVGEELVRLARYDEEMVRPHAIWALYRLFGDEAEAILRESRGDEENSDTLAEYEFWESGSRHDAVDLSELVD